MKGRATLDAFFATLERADLATLLLDYDGTLAPFQVQRDTAVPYPGVRSLLGAIREQTQTRLVIISGRALDDLLLLLGLDPPPEIWGCHGWERLRTSGHRQLYPLNETQLHSLAAAWGVIESLRLEGFCERKPASVALHWRGLSETQAVRLEEQIRREWESLSTGQMLELHPFDGGLELRATGRTKATAVNEVLAGSEQNQVAAFLGDDLTDEDGFRAICGRGLGILVRRDFRPTAAGVHLVPPHELLGFLEGWLHRAPRLKETCQ